jgi:hypothetical protein
VIPPKPPFPRPNPKRLPSGETVTIGVGLLCRDGIIVGADSEESRLYVKSQKVKLFEIPISQDVTIAGAGAGDSIFVDSVVQKFSDRLVVDRPDLVCVKEGVEEIARNACQDAWPLYSNGSKPELKLILGIRTLGELGLIHVDGPLVRSLPKYGFVGYGTDLAIYQAKKFLVPVLSIGLATPIVVHIIHAIKQNVLYCGGKTSLKILKVDGSIENKSDEYIRKTEAAYEAMEVVLALLTNILPVVRLPDGSSLVEKLMELSKTSPFLTDEQRQEAVDNMLKGFTETPKLPTVPAKELKP